jgi:hyaluronate lyase
MLAGTYRVYAQWASYPNRATNVYYTINHSGGGSPTTVGPFDQTTNSGTWIDIGGVPFTFSAGTGSVVVTDAANGIVTADAVKFEPVP